LRVEILVVYTTTHSHGYAGGRMVNWRRHRRYERRL